MNVAIEIRIELSASLSDFELQKFEELLKKNLEGFSIKIHFTRYEHFLQGTLDLRSSIIKPKQVEEFLKYHLQDSEKVSSYFTKQSVFTSHSEKQDHHLRRKQISYKHRSS